MNHQKQGEHKLRDGCGYVFAEGPAITFDEPPWPCPGCGATSGTLEFIAAPIEVGVTVDGFSAVGKSGSKTVLKARARREVTNWGSLAGTMAWVEQMVDKLTRRYKKRVTLADGTVLKDVDGPLDDQSLHGPQNQSGSFNESRRFE